MAEGMTIRRQIRAALLWLAVAVAGVWSTVLAGLTGDLLAAGLSLLMVALALWAASTYVP